MIIYNTRGLSCLLRLSGSVIPYVWMRSLACGLIGVLVVLLWWFQVLDLGISIQAHTTVSVLLGLVLMFRTNFCNERYNEGRRLVGSINNNLRSMIRLVVTNVQPGEGQDEFSALIEKNNYRRYFSALWVSIRQNIRKQHLRSEYDAFLLTNELDQLDMFENNRPQAIAYLISKLNNRLLRTGMIPGKVFQLLETQLHTIVDCWGGMQRIESTPTPFAYAHHIKLFLHVYVFTVPFALLPSMGFVTPMAALWISYALFGIDEIGVEIEEPFGEDYNDIPMDDITNAFTRLCDDTFALDTFLSGQHQRGYKLEPPHRSGLADRLQRTAEAVARSAAAVEQALRPSQTMARMARRVVMARAFLRKAAAAEHAGQPGDGGAKPAAGAATDAGDDSDASARGVADGAAPQSPGDDEVERVLREELAHPRPGPAFGALGPAAVPGTVQAVAAPAADSPAVRLSTASLSGVVLPPAAGSTRLRIGGADAGSAIGDARVGSGSSLDSASSGPSPRRSGGRTPLLPPPGDPQQALEEGGAALGVGRGGGRGAAPSASKYAVQ